MVSAILAALLIQTLSKSDLIAGGETVGRLGERTAVCRRLGYPVDELIAEDAANRFARQAATAGWDQDAIIHVIQTGVDLEQASLPFSEPIADVPADELPFHAKRLASDAKQLCRQFAESHPGVITDLAQGEQAIDDRFAAALRAR